MRKKISILGSTGSIGRQALEVVERLGDRFEIISLTAGGNIDLLNEQIAKFKPKSVCVSANSDKIIGCKHILSGMSGLEEICSNTENDIILVAVSGQIGLKPTITAIKNHINVALANKETLVMAGDIVMKLAKENGVKIIPVDSEHCAIHQCIKDISQVSKLIITASGGPFLNKTIDDIKSAPVEDALAHPRWNMGKKITVDSATLMNKGLEVIEAHHLFGMPYENIEVVIHPQSIVHSAIEYIDGSVIAQLGLPSMHIPIQYAICYPERFEGIKSKSFSFSDIARLDFSSPDYERFGFLNLAYSAGKTGGSAPAAMNVADEEAVFAFLDGKINLFEIYQITEKIYSSHIPIKNPSIDEIFEVDKEIREKTKELINRGCECLSI
ncbi:MAG: 1-deoxy-D-xylulose-5-phosphate reductoisomerase [Candidatus Gastranaerophilales bacterium]|nr:1-deoxy-D-xylulose-5-phosphate reductoisomerase [Candidatus Gastranaerophilales bacterium]